MFYGGGKLASPLSDGIPVTGKDMEREHNRLLQLQDDVTRVLLAHYIPSLLQVTHPRELYKQSIPVEDLYPGCVVFDQIGYLKSANISGNLGRVTQKSQSDNLCMIQKSYIQPDGTCKQVCVSRPANYINFICAPEDDEVIFTPKYELFQMNQCLETRQSQSPIYSLPPLSALGQATPPETVERETGDYREVVGGSTVKTGEPVRPKTSRFGRPIRPPQRFNF